MCSFKWNTQTALSYWCKWKEMDDNFLHIKISLQIHVPRLSQTEMSSSCRVATLPKNTELEISGIKIKNGFNIEIPYDLLHTHPGTDTRTHFFLEKWVIWKFWDLWKNIGGQMHKSFTQKDGSKTNRCQRLGFISHLVVAQETVLAWDSPEWR